jgi:hypothetical protein
MFGLQLVFHWRLAWRMDRQPWPCAEHPVYLWRLFLGPLEVRRWGERPEPFMGREELRRSRDKWYATARSMECELDYWRRRAKGYETALSAIGQTTDGDAKRLKTIAWEALK